MDRVLLLNASFQPLTTIPVKRAVRLVLDEKAEIVHEGKGLIRSMKMAIPRPSVIRLLRFVVVPYNRKITLNRRALIARDLGICQYCGKEGDTIDHIFPRSKGGTHTWDNIVLACRACNYKKGSKTLEQLGWKLLKQPHEPVQKAWIILAISSRKEWKEYLESIGLELV
jgi:5-methylcytosine-specific restriction endonuclease McrA